MSPPIADLLSGRILFGETVAPADAVDVLATSEEMQDWVLRTVGESSSTRIRLQRLLDGLKEDGLLSLTYDPSRNLTARETFSAHAGNCLSFSILFVALAREAGLEVTFQTVEIPLSFSSDGDLVLLNNHINVRVGKYGGAGTKDYVVDFNRPAYKETFGTERIDDDRAIGLYHGNLAVEALKTGDNRQAFAHLKRGIEGSPDDAGLWVNLGVLYSRNANYELAARAYFQALQVEANNHSALANLAGLADFQGKPDEAKGYLRTVQRHVKANPYYYQYLAEKALESMNYAAALGYLEKAITLKGNEHQFYHLAGIVHYRSGRRDLAQESFLNAVRVAQSAALKETYFNKLSALDGG